MKENDPLRSMDPSEMEALIGRAESGQLRAEDGPLIGRLLRLILMLVQVLERKNASLARLRRLWFGPRSEKRSPRRFPPSADACWTIWRVADCGLGACYYPIGIKLRVLAGIMWSAKAPLA